MIFPETVFRDLRYGARMLRRNAGATLVTLVALALGIGITTAAFTAYKAMVARPLDARAPSEMVNIALMRDSGAGDYQFSYPDYVAYRDSVRSFGGLIAFRPAKVTLSNAGGMVSQRAGMAASGLGRLGMLPSGVSNAEFAFVFVVSENYFEVLGVSAMQGRTFESRDREFAANPPVLISENYWERRFARDPGMLGKTIYLNNVAVTIAGITPRDFVGTGVNAPAFWLPIGIEPRIHADAAWLRNRENQRYRLFGRLAKGVSAKQAQQEFSRAADHLRTLHDPRAEAAKPATVLVWPGSPFPLPLSQFGGLILSVGLIMAAAAMVLLVACANVASLQLARARSRENELRTRLSLGASRLRLIRQLVTESALTGAVAGSLALLFAWGLLKVLVRTMSNAMPVEYGTLVFDVTPDLEIFAWVLVVSLAAGMLSGLTPAMEGSRTGLISGARAGTSSVRSRRIQDLLVAAQVALSLVLMIAGSMALRSSRRALDMEPGYEAKRAISLEFQFPQTAEYTATRKLALVHDLGSRLKGLPGVTAISSGRTPGGGGFRTAAVSLDGGETSSGQSVLLHYSHVQANYFETLGIPLLLGRGFESRAGQPELSVILSESAARQLWPRQNPIGRSLRLGAIDERSHHASELAPAGPAYQVAGVVRDTRGFEFDGSDSKRIYVPLSSGSLPNYPMLIRTGTDAAQVVRAVEAVVASIDPAIMVTPSTLEEMLRRSPPVLVSSLAAGIASMIGLFGLLLASMGIYGTVSYIVVLRTREVGVRMAIGAQKRDVLSLILRESARPVLAGLVAGILLAIAATYPARSLFYGLDGVDGVSLAVVSLLFLAIALLACFPPARRAMRVDPMVALRYE